MGRFTFKVEEEVEEPMQHHDDDGPAEEEEEAPPPKRRKQDMHESASLRDQLPAAKPPFVDHQGWVTQELNTIKRLCERILSKLDGTAGVVQTPLKLDFSKPTAPIGSSEVTVKTNGKKERPWVEVPSMDVVVEAAKAYKAAHGGKALSARLAEFAAAKISDIEDDKLGKFLESLG